MTTLAAIRSQLDKNSKSGTSLLDGIEGQIPNLLRTMFSDLQLAFGGKEPSPTSDRSLVLTGTAVLASTAQTRIDLSFSEIEDGSLATVLEIHFQPNQIPVLPWLPLGTPPSTSWLPLRTPLSKAALILKATELGYENYETLTAILIGTLVLNNQDINLTVRLPSGSAEEWWLEGDLRSLPISTLLREVPKLVGDDTPWLRDWMEALGEQIESLGDLSVTGYRMAFNPAHAPLVSQFSLDLAMTRPLTIPLPHVVVDCLRGHLEVFKPFETTGRMIRGSLYGTLDVDGAGIVVSAEVPELRFKGSLAEESSLNLTAVVRDLLSSMVTLPSDAPDIVLDEFAVTLDAVSHSFTIHARCFSDWQVVPHAPLTAVQVDLARFSDPPGIEASIVGVIDVGGVDVILAASHPEEGSNWRFEGSTGPGQEIDPNTLVGDLNRIFGTAGDAPEVLREKFKIVNLDAAFETGSRDFHFSGEGRFPIGEAQGDTSVREVDVVVSVDLRHSNGHYQKAISGRLFLDLPATSQPEAAPTPDSADTSDDAGWRLEFDLLFSQDGAESLLVANYQDLGGDEFNLPALIGRIADVPSNLPGNLTIAVKRALFVYEKGASKVLFGLDMEGGANLSNLPLVGKAFPSEQTLRASLQPVVSSGDFKKEELAKITPLVPAGGIALPTDDLTSGLFLVTTLEMGGTAIHLDLPLKVDEDGRLTHDPEKKEAHPPITTDGDTPAVDGVKWFDLQRSFGPVHFERVGVQYLDGDLWFYLDGSLGLGGLLLALEGLGAGLKLEELQNRNFNPKFTLHGLGLDYSNGPVEIGGSFLRTQAKDKEDQEYDEYDGIAVIKAQGLTLSAIGSYASFRGHTSLFVYAVLDYPLGGPSFFFVTGLAAGFGYNRALKMPPIEQVGQFPLVDEAVNGAGELPPPPNGVAHTPDEERRARLQAEITRLHRFLPPQSGESFLCLGVRFTSFELIDSFALVAVSFGQHFEVDILGLSTLVVPAPAVSSEVSPLAEAQLALKATLDPEQGFLSVQAQLTGNSFILSRSCHLTGGFAFFAWFAGEHAGDFVLSLGGYHPKFAVPAHYPSVPRLGFNWHLSDLITIKGDAYFALTGHAFMVGGHLEALWHSGPLTAWVRAGADFLISWQPYHYDAEIYVSIGASLVLHFFGTHHVTVELGGHLHLWGPDFSGTVTLHYYVISATISFGDAKPRARPISWETFCQSFLPTEEEEAQKLELSGWCDVSVTGGLIRRIDDQDPSKAFWIVNPKELVLGTSSLIPSNYASVGEKGFKAGETVQSDNSASRVDDLSIAPMGLSFGQVISKHQVMVTHDGEDVSHAFTCAPVLKKMPVALWGDQLQPDLNGDKFLENALAGLEIRAANVVKPPAESETRPILRANLSYSPTCIDDGFDLETPTSFNIDPDELGQDAGVLQHFANDPEAARRKFVRDHIVEQTTVAARNDLLSALGFNVAQSILADVAPATADAFILAPQVGIWQSLEPVS